MIATAGVAKQQLLLTFAHPGLANDAFAALPGGSNVQSHNRAAIQLGMDFCHTVTRLSSAWSVAGASASKDQPAYKALHL